MLAHEEVGMFQAGREKGEGVRTSVVRGRDQKQLVLLRIRERR